MLNLWSVKIKYLFKYLRLINLNLNFNACQSSLKIENKINIIFLLKAHLKKSKGVQLINIANYSN
jgi:hypothetical protein